MSLRKAKAIEGAAEEICRRRGGMPGEEEEV